MDLTPIVLEGKSVRLEPLTIDYVDALLAAGADPEIWRYMPTDCSRREGMQEYVDTAIAWQRGGTAMPFATIDPQSGAAIGSTRFANIVPEHRRVEIGWTWLAPPFQRTAINTEAKYLMLQFAFEKLGCNRVELKTSAQNMRSRNAILRIGAKEEGTLRSHMINPDGTLRDTVYFSVIAPEWAGVKKRLEGMMAVR